MDMLNEMAMRLCAGMCEISGGNDSCRLAKEDLAEHCVYQDTYLESRPSGDVHGKGKWRP